MSRFAPTLQRGHNFLPVKLTSRFALELPVHILAPIFVADLYYYMPAPFFPGEADRKGLGTVFSGFYLGAGGL